MLRSSSSGQGISAKQAPGHFRPQRWRNDELRSYGRGIFAYAAPPNTPTSSDGRYRTADFSVSASGSSTYTMPANGSGQVIGGGDSGGPDFRTPQGSPPEITGVHSTCVVSGCLARHTCTAPTPWTWVTSISQCNSAPVSGIRTKIVRAIQARYIPLPRRCCRLHDLGNIETVAAELKQGN